VVEGSARLRLTTDSLGHVVHLPQEDCVEVLRRLYVRNQDHESADFEILTAVQKYALYQLLTQNGVRVPASISARRGVEEDDE
jgi:hypothetical protein